MTPSEFITLYHKAFSAKATMPIAIGYSDKAATPDSTVARCMIGAIRQVANGKPLTLCKKNVQCGGGGLYTRFTEMPERVPVFVSEVERYKDSKEAVVEYIEGLGLTISDKPFLNFVPLDRIETWDGVEAVLFFATPDVLSGLATWAFFDNHSDDAVVTRFGSGCASAVTMAIKENAKKGRSCIIGMFDPSARLLVSENELTFAIPMSRMTEMMSTMTESALFRKAFSNVRRRIAGELKSKTK